MFSLVRKKSHNPTIILANYVLLTFFLSSYTVYGGLRDTYSKGMFSLALLIIAYLFSRSFMRFNDSLAKEDCSLAEKKKTKRKVIVYIVFIVLFTIIQIIVGWNQYTIPF